MNIDPPDSPNSPRGIDEGDDAGALQDLVRAVRSRRPSPDAVERITKQLVAAGALDAGPASEKPAAGSGGASRVASRLGYYKATAVVLAVATGSLVAARGTWWSDAPPVTSVAASGAAPSAVAPAAGAPSSAEPIAGSNGTPEIGGAGPGSAIVPAVSVDALPSAGPKARAAASAEIIPRTTSEQGAAGTSTPELLLVRRAQDALVSDPARALSLANEHAALFPSGQLTQEREVVAVDALARLGRREDARLRARALVRKFPRTPYVAHLEKAIGQPLTSPDARGDAANRQLDSKP